MPLKSLDLDISRGRCEGLVNGGVESAVLNLVVFLLSACLRNPSLFFLKLGLKLCRKLFLVFDTIDGLMFLIWVDLGFESAVFFPLRILLPLKLLSFTLAITRLVNNRGRRGDYRTDHVDLGAIAILTVSGSFHLLYVLPLSLYVALS